MSVFPHSSKSRPTKFWVRDLAVILLVTVSTAGAQPGASIFDLNLTDAHAERCSAFASSEQDNYRHILRDPQPDSETFWDREQRWSESNASSQTALLTVDDSAPLDISWANGIPVSELSLAVFPLLLAVGLLRVRTNATYSRTSYT